MPLEHSLDLKGLTQAVIVETHRLGFPLVGVTPPDPPPHYTVFEKWLSAGRHGEMAYLAEERSRQRRADPRQILADCQSILILGVPYANPALFSEPSEHPDSMPGRVAAYAWGQDYHTVLPERLKALVTFIEQQADHPVSSRVYTDTGPVLERDLAQRAGLGWVGKNTCLIHPRLGSYFFLAEILLGLPLVPDEPFVEDRCGSCRRCLEACPTGCILPDRTLDATRCIAYLTIELKGALPADLRSRLGEWVFGCDVCQQVCPWNQHSIPSRIDPAFAPRPGLPRPDLALELALTPQDFNRKFKASPLLRAKRSGYLRSAAVALGNLSKAQPEASAVTALTGALHDPEPLVRSHAAWALGQIQGASARQALEQALKTEAEAAVVQEIRLALRG